ncbi:glycosyltransferase family 2 protein [uncultured Bacteroides sp.]|uniref:glycosyltransferase family 2 protein n=1 Tax=uncultured Bacteroides sp. TaxID=162156 RepID=UPI00263966F4|nr:glycosyltransferase family 2 protein [uncultured Bacteroides sp.]
MKVSILVPVYGVEKYIEKCIVSLFEQTFDDIEYIFVNDCTKDCSIAVLQSVMKRYPNRVLSVRIVNHECNKGLAASRNTAVGIATGEYLMHVDSDDYIERDTVEKCVAEIERTAADAVVFGFRNIFEGKEYIEHAIIPNDMKEYVCKIIRRECSVCICGGLYRRSLYVDNHVYAIEGVNMGEDYATKPRLMYYAKKVVAIDEPLYNYVHYNYASYTKNFTHSTIDNLVRVVFVLTSFFEQKMDYAFYKDSLSVACLLNKIVLLKYWVQSDASITYLDKINALYPLENNFQLINKSHKLILYLSLKRWTNLLRIYVKFGIKINQLLS